MHPECRQVRYRGHIQDHCGFASLPGHHGRRPGNRRMAAGDCLDLAEFNPVPHDLDLSVTAAGKFQATILPPSATVAGPVKTPEGCLPECLPGQGLLPEIPAGKPGPADPDLAEGPDPDRMKVIIEHLDRGIEDRAANGDRTVIVQDGRGHHERG